MANHTFFVDKRLIIVPVRLHGSKHFFDAQFVLDTGASYTIVDHRIAESIGYTQNNATAPSRVSSATGKEEGFRIKIASIETLGKCLVDFEVACHALLEQGVEGLIGMNFLEKFDFCIFPSKKNIQI